jgi:hypothetical protein
MSEAQPVDRLTKDSADDGQPANLTERLFYTDCCPELARSRTKRAQEVADILNSCRSFGTARTREMIRSVFQVEVDTSTDAAEAASKMGKLVSIINLRLAEGLGLGPEGLPVKNTLYFVIAGVAFSQRLSLDLKPNYKKESEIRTQNPFAA